jgi:hypothetical protein
MPTKASQREQALELMRTNPELSDRAIARRLAVSNKSVSRWRAQHQIARGADAGFGGIHGAELAAELARVGVSDDQFRRWRGDGLLPEPDRHSCGSGSVAVYERSIIEQAAVVKELMRRYRRKDQVALGLFAMGWPIDIDRVRRAYLAWLEVTMSSYELYANVLQGDEEWDEWFEWLDEQLALSRRFRFIRTSAEMRARGRGEDERPGRRDELGDERTSRGQLRRDRLLATAEAFVRGTLSDPSDLEEMLRADNELRVSAGVELVDVDEAVRAIERTLPSISGPALIDVATTATAEELTTMCEMAVFLYLGILGIFEVGHRFLPNVPPPPAGHSIAEHTPEDPSAVARITLYLAALTRTSDEPTDLAELSRNMRELVARGVRAFYPLREDHPRLRWLLHRYLARRADGPW